MIKIKFVDFWEDFKKGPCEFYSMIIEMNLFEEVDKKPQILFYSNFGNEHVLYHNCIKIFFDGEYEKKEKYEEADYCIGFRYSDKKNWLRFPLWRTYRKALKIALEKPVLEKTKFCSFIVSNPTVTIRNLMFERLNTYKKIDSGGKYKNNIGYLVSDKLDFNKSYKFNLCFENKVREGYTTEKILEAFASGCIPIYLGDPLNEFNPKAFITGKNLEDIFKKTIEIDSNEELYKKMLKEPLGIKENNDLENFIFKIIKENKLI